MILSRLLVVLRTIAISRACFALLDVPVLDKITPMTFLTLRTIVFNGSIWPLPTDIGDYGPFRPAMKVQSNSYQNEA